MAGVQLLAVPLLIAILATASLQPCRAKPSGHACNNKVDSSSPVISGDCAALAASLRKPYFIFSNIKLRENLCVMEVRVVGSMKVKMDRYHMVSGINDLVNCRYGGIKMMRYIAAETNSTVLVSFHSTLDKTKVKSPRKIPVLGSANSLPNRQVKSSRKIPVLRRANSLPNSQRKPLKQSDISSPQRKQSSMDSLKQQQQQQSSMDSLKQQQQQQQQQRSSMDSLKQQQQSSMDSLKQQQQQQQPDMDSLKQKHPTLNSHENKGMHDGGMGKGIDEKSALPYSQHPFFHSPLNFQPFRQNHMVLPYTQGHALPLYPPYTHGHDPPFYPAYTQGHTTPLYPAYPVHGIPGFQHDQAPIIPTHG